MPGDVAAGFATCALGRLELARAAPDGPADVMVRPEQIRFESHARPGAAEGQVLAVTYYGHDASVAVSLDAGAEPVMARVAGHMAPEQGDRSVAQRRRRGDGLSAHGAAPAGRETRPGRRPPYPGRFPSAPSSQPSGKD